MAVDSFFNTSSPGAQMAPSANMQAASSPDTQTVSPPNRQPSDAAVRAQAIDPSKSFIVQAPAGSGKTELLTDRILALLATVNRPEEIVAITFTRKAAAEMHKRVMDKLRAANQVSERSTSAADNRTGTLDGHVDAPEGGNVAPHKQRSYQLACGALQRSREKGWHILDYPARLSIRTIDAFCSHLVRSMPWLSRLGGLPAIADNANELYQAAARETLAMVDYEPNVVTLLKHLDVDGRTAQELLASSLACRDQWLELLKNGDADLLSDNLEFVLQQDLELLAASMPLGWAGELGGCVRDAAKYLGQLDPPPKLDISALASWDGQPFDTDPAIDLVRWQALARLLLTASGQLRARVTKSEGFEPKTRHKETFAKWLDGIRLASGASNPAWVSALHDIRSAPCGYTPDQLETLNALLNVLRLAAAQLQLQFMQAGQVDFMEIAQRAAIALGEDGDPADGGNPTDLLLKLDASIQHILVDEFQDTSQSQIDLLNKLTSGWTNDDGRTVFLVGDPMQSIYRFRKAEVGLFLQVQDKGLEHVGLESLSLTDNFRSDSGVVEWVNSTFSTLFPSENNEALGGIKYTESLAFNGAGDDPAVEFHPVWLDPNAKGRSSDDASRRTEALVVTLARQALARHPNSDHPAAILVRARSHLEGVVRSLSANGVACQAVELEALASRQLIDDLAQLARALSHDGDRLAWLCVLRSPVCGLTLNSLHALFGNNPIETVPSRLRRWLSSTAAKFIATTQSDGPVQPEAITSSTSNNEPILQEDEALRLRHVAAVLLDTSNSAGAIPFAAWLQQCWQRLGGPSVYSTTADTADAQQFFRLIERLAPYGGLDASALDAGLTRLYASSESMHPAVQVMTIHKAKGLQFDTVIIMGLHRPPKADVAPLVRFDLNGRRVLLGPIKPRAQTDADPVSDYLANRDKQRASYETDRLLYVAATRACSHLHLIATVSCGDDNEPKKPASATLLARLWDTSTVVDALVRTNKGSSQNEHVSADASNASSQPANGSQSSSTTHAAENTHMEENAYNGFDVQPKKLIRLQNVAQPDPAIGVLSPTNRARKAWAWPAIAGDEAVIGSVAHAWLEYLGKQGIAQWTSQRVAGCMPQFKAQLSRRGVLVSQLDHAADIVRQTLTATLASTTGQWLLSAAKGYREWSLVDAAGRVSVIDLALSDEQGWLVVDYKTGLPGTDETTENFSARMRERYNGQITHYCQQLTALDGRSARGALYFPRADIWIDCQ